MNNQWRGNKASMLRKDQQPRTIASSVPICDHFSKHKGYRLSPCPPPLKRTWSRIPHKSRSNLDSSPKPAIPEEKEDRRAIPAGMQERKSERNASTNRGSLSKPEIPKGKQDREDRKTKPVASAKRRCINTKSYIVGPCDTPKPAPAPEHEPEPVPEPEPAPEPTALETKLTEEVKRLTLTTRELQRKLLDCQNKVSEQELQLAESKAAQRSKAEAIMQLKAELDAAKADCGHMFKSLEYTNAGLECATKKVNKQVEHSNHLECELKEAHITIASLHKQQEVDAKTIRELQKKLELANAEVDTHCQAEAQLREDVDMMHVQLEAHQQEQDKLSNMIQSMQVSEKGLGIEMKKRDKLLIQLINDLAVRDEEFRNLFTTVEYKQTKLREQEDSIKKLEKENTRQRTKMEERNAALEKEIVGLKAQVREFTQVIIGNNAKPFFEVISTPVSEDSDDELGPSQESQTQQQGQPSRRHY